MKNICCFLLVLTLLGCAMAQRINDVQVGMTREEVISAIGKPTSISAKDGIKYLNYRFSETIDHAIQGVTIPYYVRLINGRVDSYGRAGDFDSTQKPTVRVDTEESVNFQGNDDLYNSLRKLKELRDEGVLTEEEYQEQKQKLLRQ